MPWYHAVAERRRYQLEPATYVRRYASLRARPRLWRRRSAMVLHDPPPSQFSPCVTSTSPLVLFAHLVAQTLFNSPWGLFGRAPAHPWHRASASAGPICAMFLADNRALTCLWLSSVGQQVQRWRGWFASATRDGSGAWPNKATYGTARVSIRQLLQTGCRRSQPERRTVALCAEYEGP